MAKSKYLAVLSASAVVSLLVGATTAMAADGDIYNKDNKTTPFVEKSQYEDEFDKLEEAVYDYENYFYEFNGKVYPLGVAGTRIGEEINDQAIDKILNKMAEEVNGQDLKEFKGEEKTLKVEKVSAINANTISVTFNGMKPVEIKLQKALVHGENEVAFEYEGQTFNEKVNYVDPEVVEAEKLAAAITAAEEAIAELPTVEEVAIEDAQAVADAKALVEAVKELDEEAVVEGEEVIAELEAKIEELEAEQAEQEKAEAIKNAIDKINAIGKPATLTLEDEAKVVAARTAVNAAKELGAVDADIVNLDHLNAAETQINALKEALNEKETAIQEANVALTNLPLEVTLDNEEQVNDAAVKVAKALELGAEESDFVNLWKLENAQGKIGKLNSEKEAQEKLKEAIDKAEKAIEVLPSIEEVKINDKEKVANAKALDEAVKALNPEAVVKGEDVISKLEAKIAELEKVAQKTLKVEKVSAIDKTKVDVKITALTEALTDVTVEVKDNNGNVVEVKPVAVLDVGETVATFTFKTALTANPAGEWTVNGVKFDADAQAAAAKVNAATNQVELLTALKSTYFTGVVDANIAAYKTEIDTNKPYATVADIQKAIDKVNKAGVTGELISDIKDAMDDNNEVALLTLLGDASFERVNADFITQYMAAFKTATAITTSSTVANVQAKIDGVNLAEATAAVTAADTTPATALKADSIAKAQELVSALPEKEVAEKTAKKALQDRIDKANAFAKVKGATTQASLLSALKAPVLKLQNIDDTLAKYYKQVFDAVKDNITNVTYNLQSNIVDAGKTAAINDYVTKISKIDDKTALTDVKALLTELKRLDGTNFTEDIIDALLEDYRAGIVAGTITGTTSINTIIQTANDPSTALTALADASNVLDDADKLLLALKAKTLNLKNVIDANKDAYFADKAAIQTAAGSGADAVQTGSGADAVQKAINTINFVADANAATTAAEMQTALTGIAVNESVTAYVKLSSAAKAEVAELVLAARAEETGKVFADLAAVSGEITTQTTAYTGFLTGVNAATDIDAMMTALDKAAFPAYQELGAVEKVEKAELVFNELNRLKALDPVEKFETIAEIKAAAGL